MSKLETEKNKNKDLTVKLSNATSEIVKANREKNEKEQVLVTLKNSIEELRKEIICLREKNEWNSDR